MLDRLKRDDEFRSAVVEFADVALDKAWLGVLARGMFDGILGQFDSDGFLGEVGGEVNSIALAARGVDNFLAFVPGPEIEISLPVEQLGKYIARMGNHAFSSEGKRRR